MVGDAHQQAALVLVAARRARLRQPRMQIDRVRHDGGADDADRNHQRLGVGQSRNDRMIGRRAPVDRRDEHLDQIAKADDADQAADDQLHRPEAAAFHHQDGVGDDGGDAHAVNQRHLEQQRQADRAAEKFGKIGGHGGDLADPPHRHDDRFREIVAAHFREIAAGDDAELGRQRLEQHGDQVGEQHDPQQRVAVFRAGLDVGGEIAGVHVGDRGDHRRAGEGQIGPRPAAFAAQNGLRRQHRTVGERFGGRGFGVHPA